MKRIFGRVLVKETNVGIPNLVVAVFDVDSSSAPGIDPTKASASTADESAAELSPASLSMLQNRLGSILTDASGTFELPISEETSQHYGADQTPDLVVTVFAPEDSFNVHNPIPRPAEERLLYLSRSPRAKAGPVEAYVIRISQAQLDTFGIPAGTAGNNVADEVNSFMAGFQRRASIQQQLRDQLAPALQTRVDRVREVRTSAKTVFANLASVPPGLRNYPYFVKDPKDVKTAAQVQAAAIEAGLARLGNYKGIFVLRLRDDELANLGLQKDNTGGFTGQHVDAKLMAERLMSPSSGPDLVRKRTLLDATVSPDDRLAAAEAAYKAAHPVKASS